MSFVTKLFVVAGLAAVLATPASADQHFGPLDPWAVHVIAQQQAKRAAAEREYGPLDPWAVHLFSRQQLEAPSAAPSAESLYGPLDPWAVHLIAREQSRIVSPDDRPLPRSEFEPPITVGVLAADDGFDWTRAGAAISVAGLAALVLVAACTVAVRRRRVAAS